MKSFRELMAGQTLLPIIQANNPQQGVDIAKAMANAGLKLVEVVLRTEASLAALQAIKQALPELIVGAGTIVDKNSLTLALNAGADFIVTPAISDRLLVELTQVSVPVLPGVSNTGDILLAKEYGFTELKLFPASLSGGAPFIAAMAAVFPDLWFCPTGGVNQVNKGDYLSLPNCFAVGGTWVVQADWVKQGNWQCITEACHIANQR